jgi:hypothetical protein
MRKTVFVALITAAALAACSKQAVPDAGSLEGDVLGADKGTTIAMTVNCLEPVSDGTCNKKTCKKDETSDCADFGAACIKSDHKYEGTKDEGTCTRVKINI